MNLLECLGVCDVANNKETDTNEIFVTLPPDFPSQDGENIAGTNQVNTAHQTSSGDIKAGKVLVANTVPATWMSLNSNRVTAPDVRVGSKVALYQFKNSNKYYWTLYGLNGSMRLETVVFAVSASPNIDENTPITPDNYYIFTISSHKKKIELLTGQGNGEALGYQFTLDMENGWYGCMDSLGQIFLNNGIERSLTYINKDKTQLSINKKDFTLLNEGNTLIDTKESILMRSKNITLLAQELFKLKAGRGEIEFDTTLTHKVGSTLTQSVGSTYGLTVGGKYTQNVSGGIDITTGLVTMSKDLAVTSSITSDSVSAKTIDASSKLTVGKINVGTHKHNYDGKKETSSPLE